MELFGLGIVDIIIRLVLGLFIGFCIGLTGVGGGVLGIQATSLVLGLDPIRAVGTTSFYLFLTNINAAFQHYRLGNISWGSIFPILAGALPSNIVCSILISKQSSNDQFKSILGNLILFIVFVAIAAMAINMMKKTVDPDAAPGGRITNCRKQKVIAFFFGITFGGIVGATSVGGGILLVPALILLGLSSRQTVGSAIFITMTLTCITALVYGVSGEVDRVSAITMAIGSLVGVWAGSRYSAGISDRTLKKIMLGIIFAVATAMLLSQR